MIASLPMYWRAANAHLWQEFWRHVQVAARPHGLTLPDLTAPADIPTPWRDHWLRPDLMLSMTCGLPLRSALRGRVTYVGTLGFGLKAPPGQYFSRVVTSKARYDAARKRQLPGWPDAPVLAYNAADSQSGWAVTQLPPPFVQPLTFGGFVETGSHEGSVRAVIEGRADIAYIDAVTWRILKRDGIDAGQLQLLGQSASTPALPLITALGNDPAPLRAALHDAVLAFSPKDPLPMGGPLSLHILEEDAYLSLPLPAPPPDK